MTTSLAPRFGTSCAKLLGAAIALLLAASPAFGVTGNDTWIGTTDANWSTGTNWIGANTPPAAGDTLVFGTVGTGGATLTNDFAVDTSFLGLAFNNTAPSFTLSGNEITSTGGIVDNSLNLQTVNLGIVFAATHSLGAATGANMVINGKISGVGGITKTGNGQVTLTGASSGANTYTGTTTVSGGTLKLDFSTGGSTPSSNIISSGSALALSGGTLAINGTSSTASSQTFASTTLTGSNALTTNSSGTGSVALTLGAISQTALGTTLVINPTGTTTLAGTAGTNVTATAGSPITSGTAGFVSGAFVTYGLNDFAQIASGVVMPLGAANYTVNAGPNVDMTSSFTSPSSTTSVNVFRVNTPAALTFTNKTVYTSGAILVTPAVGSNNTIITSSGSTHSFETNRSSTSGSEGVIWQNNTSGYLSFQGANTLDNGKTGAATWVQAGPGTVQWNQNSATANGFTGSMYLNGGYTLVSANGDAVFGAVATAAALNINGGAVVAGANFTLDNAGANKRPVVIGITGGTLSASTGNVLTVDGVVSGTGTLGIGTGTVAGSGASTANPTAVIGNGTVILNGGANTYTGGTALNAGTLNFTSGSLGSGGVTFNGGYLQYGASTTTDLTANNLVTVNSGGGTLDTGTNNVTFATAGNMTGTGALTKLGSGTLTLSSGVNLPSGGLTLGAGGLVVNAGSQLNSGAVSVASGASLGIATTSTVSGQLTLNGTLTPGNAGTANGTIVTVTLGNNLILNSDATLNFDITAGTANDTLAVGSALTINGANNSINLNIFNTDGSAFSTPGTYTLFTYGSLGGSGSASTFLETNPALGYQYSFSSGSGILSVTVTALPSVFDWNTSSGNWSTAGSWTRVTGVDTAPPSTAGQTVVFNTVSGAGGNVTVDGNFTTGVISFNSTTSPSTTYTLANDGTHALTLNNSGASAQISDVAGNQTVAAPVILNANVTLSATNATDTLTISGLISDNATHTVTVTGNGTVALGNGSNSYAGGTNLNSGILSFVSGALSTGGVNFNGGELLWAPGNTQDISSTNTITFGAGGASLDPGANQTVTLASPIGNGGTGGLTKVGATSTLILTATNNFSGPVNANAGTLQFGNLSNLGTGTAINFNGGSLQWAPSTTTDISTRTVTFNSGGATLDTNGNNVTLANTVGNSGTGGLTKTGNGVLTLGATASYGGSTVVNQGTLAYGINGALPSGTDLTVNSGGTLNTSTFNGTLSSISGAGNIAMGGGTLTEGTSSSTTFGGNLTGTGTLAKQGSGTLNITGASSFSGTVNINAGVISINPGANFSGGAVNVAAIAGAELLINGGNLVSSASSNVGIGSIGLSVVSGTASFNGGLTQDLGGASANDLISVSGGTLNALNVALGRSGLSVTSQPSSGVTTTGLYINGGAVNISGNLDMSTSSLVNSSANARMDSGSLTVGGAVTIGLNNSGRWTTLDINGGNFTSTDTTTGVSIGGPLPGNAILLVRAGTSTINRIQFGETGNNTASSVLSLTGGNLYLGSGGIVVGANSTTTNSIQVGGGVLGAAADWSSSIPLTISGGSIQAADASNVAHNITLSGAMGGSGTLTKTGGGVLTLSNPSNSFSGQLNINAGTVLLPTGSGLSGPSGVTVNSGGALVGNSTIGGSGVVTVNGGGRLGGTGTGSSIFNLPNLTLAPNSTIALTISSTNGVSDSINLGSGLLTFGANGTYIVDLTGSGYTSGFYTYTLISFGSESGYDAGNMTFSAVGLPPGVDPIFGVTGTSLTLSVPEPSTYALALGGAALLIVGLRRRKQSNLLSNPKASKVIHPHDCNNSNPTGPQEV